jgi:hypothetical protein
MVHGPRLLRPDGQRSQTLSADLQRFIQVLNKGSLSSAAVRR